ncbi:MAG: hypothetical protein CMM50_05750 [Rhodospirillaceae bacterium]|nr:hypothetical protein [Rhodospirillaceae bacterium]
MRILGMNVKFVAVAGAVLAGFVGLSSSPSQAAIIWDVDQSVFCTATSPICSSDKLDARTVFTFSDDTVAGEAVVKLEIGVENKSTFSDGSKLTGLAFNLPGVGDSVVDFDLGAFTFSEDDKIEPRGTFDACIHVGNKCQSGSPTNGLGQGESALFTLYIDADPVRFAAEYESVFTPNPITFRFQAIKDSVLGLSDGSAKVGGSITTLDVPEPAPLALLGSAVLAFALARRRRTKAL